MEFASDIYIEYNGDNDEVYAIGKDEARTFTAFKKEARKYLRSGMASTEDREILEQLL